MHRSSQEATFFQRLRSAIGGCAGVLIYLGAAAFFPSLLAGEAATPGSPPGTAGELDRTGAAVEALKRLKGVDLEGSPAIRTAVMKVLEAVRGKPQFVELVQLFSIRGEEAALIDFALQEPATSAGVEAARSVLAGDPALLRHALAHPEAGVALKAAEVLGNVGNRQANDLLLSLATDSARPLDLRKSAVRNLAKSEAGALELLKLAGERHLPDDIQFTVSAALHVAPWPGIRAEAAKTIPLPHTRNHEPLPPASELVEMKGDPGHGAEIFANEQTGCSACHQVKGSGTNFAPDLSEIGSKLSKEALLEAILSPSAGISVGYEGWQIELKNGDLATGIVVSDTAEAVSVRQASGVATTFKKEEIATREKMNVSLMPTGLEQAMTAQDLVDLIEYLASLKKVDNASPLAP